MFKSETVGLLLGALTGKAYIYSFIMERNQKQLKCLTLGDGLVNYTMLPWYKGYVAMKNNGHAGYVETCGKDNYIYSVKVCEVTKY